MKCIFIYNPNGGSSKKIVKHLDLIKSRLKEKFTKVDIVPTKYAGHATELAKQACGKYDYLVLAGGDGTFNEVINGIATEKEKPILGYIPAGTACDMAHNLGMSKNVKKCLDRLLHGVEKEHDICRINDKYFVYVAAIGGYSAISYDAKSKAKKALGRIAYLFAGIACVFKIRNKPIHMRIEVNGKSYIGKYSYIFIANTKSVGGFNLYKNADLTDGMVDVYLLRKSFMNGLPKLGKLVLLGAEKSKKDKYIRHLQSDKVKVHLENQNLAWNLDGEKGLCGDAEFEVLKEKVEMIEYIKK